MIKEGSTSLRGMLKTQMGWMVDYLNRCTLCFFLYVLVYYFTPMFAPHTPTHPNLLLIQTRPGRYGFNGYGYRYGPGYQRPICTCTRGTCIHVPSGYTIPMLITTSSSNRVPSIVIIMVYSNTLRASTNSVTGMSSMRNLACLKKARLQNTARAMLQICHLSR